MVTVYLGSLRFPIAPESIRVTLQSGNERRSVIGLGEVTLLRGRKQRSVSFRGYFPGKSEREHFPFSKETPEEYGRILEQYLDSGKFVRFSISGSAYPCSFPATIEKCAFLQEDGGDGLSFELTVTEYRSFETAASEFLNAGSGGSKRPDLREQEETVVYTVKTGDTLWAIAKRYLGDGMRYQEIASYNGIANPHLIYAGQEVKIRL